jgi:hypothetical protein
MIGQSVLVARPSGAADPPSDPLERATIRVAAPVFPRDTRPGGTMLLEGKNAVIDARDEAAVSEHADGIAAAAGSLDVSFNAIAVDHIQGVPLADMSRRRSWARSRVAWRRIC